MVPGELLAKGVLFQARTPKRSRVRPKEISFGAACLSVAKSGDPSPESVLGDTHRVLGQRLSLQRRPVKRRSLHRS